MNTYVEVVSGFRSMSRDELISVLDRYSLSIGISELTFCQELYRSKEKRDPTLPELLLLDRMIVRSEKEPSTFILTGIESTDPELGEIFSDVDKKLRALGKKPPYSFYDIARAADRYLARAGKKSGTPALYGKCASLGELEFFAKGARPILKLNAKSASYCTLGKPVAPPYSHAKANEHDAFVVMTKNDPELKNSQLYEAIGELLCNPSINGYVKSATTLEGDLISYMLSSGGAYTDITNFPGYEHNQTPTLLTEKRNDAIVLLIDGKALMQLSELAMQKGIRTVAFGRPLSAKKFSVRYSNAPVMTIGTELINSLRFAAHLTAKSGETAALREPSHENFEFGEAFSFEHILCSASATQEATLEDTADTVIAAVTPLIAKGVGFESISVSFDVSLPLLGFSAADAHDALALLLGQYRAQAELSLVSEGSRYRTSKNELSLVAYTRAFAPEHDIPDTVTSDTGRLFVLAPHRSGSFADFEELRALFKHIVWLIKENKALAVRAVGRDGVAAALAKMAPDAELSEYILPDELEKFPVGAFIVESREELRGVSISYKTTANGEL